MLPAVVSDPLPILNGVLIYVFGDEFTGKSIDEVVNTVDRLNRRGDPSAPSCTALWPITSIGSC